MVLTLGASPDTAQVTVPQLVGLTAVEANRLLLSVGLNITVAGAKDFKRAGKTVARQSIAAGEAVPMGTAVTVWFPYDEREE